MRRIVLLACCLIIAGLCTHVAAQTTIYEVLKVQRGTCPLPLQKIEPKTPVENKPVATVGDNAVNTTVTEDLPDLAQGIPGKTSAPLVQGYLIEHLSKIQTYLAQTPVASTRPEPVFTFVDQK